MTGASVAERRSVTYHARAVDCRLTGSAFRLPQAGGRPGRDCDAMCSPDQYMTFRPAKIISGGQTGVDRAALDAAIALSIPHGGWCPRGRLAEDGSIPNVYQLEECESPDYHVRTELNVRDSDGTLILFVPSPSSEAVTGETSGDGGIMGAPYPEQLKGGTKLTYELAIKYRRPLLVVNLDRPPPAQLVYRWLSDNRIAVLNVAGPRESQSPGIAQRTYNFLLDLFALRSDTS